MASAFSFTSWYSDTRKRAITLVPIRSNDTVKNSLMRPEIADVTLDGRVKMTLLGPPTSVLFNVSNRLINILYSLAKQTGRITKRKAERFSILSGDNT